MRILVTGASGFIGSHVSLSLLAAGHQVLAQHRRAQLPGRLTGVPAGLSTLRQAFNFSDPGRDLHRILLTAWKHVHRSPWADLTIEDLAVPHAWQEAADALVAGNDALVHVAASTIDWGSTDLFLSHNVYPVLALLDAARRHGLKRVVLVSSMAVHGFGPHTQTSEAGPYFPVNNPYPLSKRLAESVALAYRKAGLDIRIVRPGNVYGPGDTTTFFRIFEAMEKGMMGTIARGRYRTCPIHVSDLCRGIVAAVETPATATGIYDFCTSADVRWADLVREAALALGIKTPRLNMPGFLARAAGVVLEGIYRLIRSPVDPPLTAYRTWQLTTDYWFTCAASRSELAWHDEIGLSQGMAETAADYRRQQGTGS